MRTCKNVVLEVQLKIFFISWKNLVQLSRHPIFYVLNNSMNFDCDVMMSINVQGRQQFLNKSFQSHIIWLRNLVNQ